MAFPLFPVYKFLLPSRVLTLALYCIQDGAMATCIGTAQSNNCINTPISFAKRYEGSLAFKQLPSSRQNAEGCVTMPLRCMSKTNMGNETGGCDHTQLNSSSLLHMRSKSSIPCAPLSPPKTSKMHKTKCKQFALLDASISGATNHWGRGHA